MIREKKVDLHMHSSVSDGLLSPRALAELAAGAGLSAFALTDHDTVEGLNEAGQAAGRLGIEFVPGVEVGVVEKEVEIHLLAYYPRRPGVLQGFLTALRQERHDRMDRMLAGLHKLGFKVEREELEAHCSGAAPGRLHLARLLLARKYVHSVGEAFSLYIGRGRPAYVPRKTLTVAETMRLFREALAIPVIAHPGGIALPVIENLIDLGLKGIEVYHPDHGAAQRRRYLGLARERGLLVTGGSDFHGDRPVNPVYPADLAVPYTCLAEMKNLLD